MSVIGGALRACSLPAAVAQRAGRPQPRHVVLGLLALLAAASTTPSAAVAGCSPATGDNVTVTCSGATLNQGPGINTGYGGGAQTGLTLNVQAAASVAGTSIGIDVGDNNTINNLGTVTTAGNGLIGDVWGINAGANLTVSNSGTIGRLDIPNNLFDSAGINAGNGLSVTNNSGATIQGTAGIQGVGTGTVVNSGLISGLTGGGGGVGIDYSANNTSQVTVTNNASGVITGDAFGINANSAVVYNYGTISAPTPGNGGTGLNANTLVLTNYASGLVTGDAFGVSGSQTPNLTITNLGTISSTGFAGVAISGNTVNLVNSGTVSATAIAGQAISMNSGSITNNAGGTITGDVGIAAFGNTSVFNAGTITGNSGPAIIFSTGGNTLTLGPDSVINGAVQGSGNDTFQLGGTGTASFDAGLLFSQYSGFATFNKVGGSTWTLTGINPVAMPWNVDAGTLDVEGTLVNATMTVNAGGTLAGAGTVGDTTVTSGGTLAPGNATAGSSLTVQGNLTFQPGAVYMPQLTSGTSTFAHATGTAALAGTVAATLAPGSTVSKQYMILLADGGRGGAFDAASVLGAPGLVATLSYDATHAYLNLAANFGGIPGTNANQQSVGNALSNFFNTTGSLPAAFANLTPAGLTQLSGELATGSQQPTFDAMSLFLGLLTDPVFGGGGGAGSTSGATYFADDAYAYAGDGARRDGARDALAAIYRKAPTADAPGPRWSVWAASYGGSQTTDGNVAVGSNTASSRIFGTAVGADYRFSPSTLAGFALAGGATNFSLANALGSGHSDLFQAGAYLRHRAGPAYLAAALAYGWQDVTTDRTVTVAGVDRLRAEFNANAVSGRLEGGYRFATPWMGIAPYAAAQFTTFALPAYAETAISGANTFALGYAAKDVTDPRSELGLRTDKSFALPQGILTLRGRLAWAHDFTTDRNIAATFQALPGAAFVVNGAAQAHDAALTTTSAEIHWLNGFSLAASFEGEFSDVTRSYAGKAIARYTW